MTTIEDFADEQRQLRRMRGACWLEGSTLLLLVLVAMPLKHLMGFPAATRILGPVHGLAFLLYIWTLLQTISAGGWSRAEKLRMAAAAIVPFGAFFTERALASRQAALGSRA